MTKMSNRIAAIVWPMLTGLVLVGIAVLVGYCLFSSSEEGGLWGISPPLILRQQGYMEIIRDIEVGRLPISKHVVSLPRGSASVAKKVYAERRADGRLFVLFVTFVGRGDADVTGYLYCSRPLGSADFHSTVWGSGGIHKEIDALGISDLEPVHIRGPWYHVCRRLG
jgi:hypothetical protein